MEEDIRESKVKAIRDIWYKQVLTSPKFHEMDSFKIIANFVRSSKKSALWSVASTVDELISEVGD